MSQQLLAMAAELEDRQQRLQDPAFSQGRKTSKSPGQNSTLGRHISVYWGDSRESGQKEGSTEGGNAWHST
jgi:hypothetical protein